MFQGSFSTKRLAIDKANSTLLIAVSIAVFITVFSLFAGKSLISQGKYQAKVIQKKEKARDQLIANAKSVEQLNASYQEFAGAKENVLGGSPKGTAGHDGENPRIVLDALPSKYDFPALATSIEKLLKENNFAIINFTGTDDEISQATNTTSSNPQAVEIPFSVEVNTSAQSAKNLISLFERSIRPIQLQKLSISGQNEQLKISISAKTFFQPEKNLTIKKEPVK